MSVETRTPRARIVGTGRYLPPPVVEAAEPAAVEDTEAAAPKAASAAPLDHHAGVVRRRVAAAGETTSDMAAAAGRAALDAAGLSAGDVDILIVATTSGDAPMPATAVYVQQKLGFELIPSFDLSASFTGFLVALSVADQFVSSGAARHVLVVGAEALSRLAAPDDPAARALLGDGAGAVVVGPAAGDGRGILSAPMRADGGLAGCAYVPGGGAAEPHTSASIAQGRHFLRLDAPALLRASAERLPALALAAISAAGLTPAEIDWVVPQKLLRPAMDGLVKQLNIAPARVLAEIDDVGETGAASVPIAFDEAVRAGRVLPGHRVLLCSAGGGLTWSAAVVRW